MSNCLIYVLIFVALCLVAAFMIPFAIITVATGGLLLLAALFL